MQTRREVKRMVQAKAQSLDVFSSEDLIRAWEKETGKSLPQLSAEYAKVGAGYVSAVLDMRTVLIMIGDLGVKGKVVLKVAHGKQYVIFKGYAGQRSIFNAARYLAANPKVVDMAIGQVGVRASVVAGARLTIFLVVPLNVINYLLNDHSSLSRLIGTIATDLLKVGAASVVAALIATGTATVTTIAAGPLIVAIGVGLFVGYSLDKLDKKFGVTDLLVSSIERSYDVSFGEVGRQLDKGIKVVEKRMRWQLNNGLPVGQGIFY